MKNSNFKFTFRYFYLVTFALIFILKSAFAQSISSVYGPKSYVTLGSSGNDYISLSKSFPDMTSMTVEMWIYSQKNSGEGVLLMDGDMTQANDLIFDMGPNYICLLYTSDAADE